MEKSRKTANLKRRIDFDLIETFGIKEFYVGGGVFLENFKDVDIFPVGKAPFLIPDRFDPLVTSNATTVRNHQFCNFLSSSLKGLVDSFDFNHCQIGAHFVKEPDGWVVKEEYSTPGFKHFLNSGEVHYIRGSKFPFSSLTRVPRVYEKFGLSQGHVASVMIDILNDIAQRGFRDLEDANEQLKGVYNEAAISDGEFFQKLSKT